MARKNSANASVGNKGAPARAANLTPDVRSNSTRKAASRKQAKKPPVVDTSEQALADLLKRLTATGNPGEIRKLSDQIERIVFHKQFANA